MRCGAKTQCGICDLVFLCGWLGCAPVLIDQSAEYSVALDRGVEGDHGGRIVGRRVLVKPLVRPVVIEMTHVLVQDGLCVSFVVDQQPVGAFGADAADKSFRVAVCPGRARRDLDHGDAFGGEDGVEGIGELGVPVTDQEPKRANPLIEILWVPNRSSSEAIHVRHTPVQAPGRTRSPNDGSALWAASC